jgi:hypothetical protein
MSTFFVIQDEEPLPGSCWSRDRSRPWGRSVDVLGDRLPNATVLELPGDHASHIQSIDAFLEAFEKHLTA